jgi:catechol 2,3-dioxygenase-like lactoylglutathione lyase family enzyme
MQVERLDHFVLTVKDIETTVNFYTRVLGMEKVVFGDERVALTFGHQKINLHLLGNEFEPKAGHVASGSADLCFIVNQPVSQVVQHLENHHVPIIDGPVERTGATGKILSVYFRDPDENLIEVSNYIDRS